MKLFFSPQLIIGWEEIEDYPNWEESGELGIQLSDSEWDDLTDQGFPRSGEQLAGWPNWTQSIERASIQPLLLVQGASAICAVACTQKKSR